MSDMKKATRRNFLKSSTAVAGIALGYKALTIGIMGIVGPIISLSVAVPLAAP